MGSLLVKQAGRDRAGREGNKLFEAVWAATWAS